jgi:hypothetical protein
MSFLSSLAHGSNNDIESSINALGIRSVLGATLILVVLLAISFKVIKNKKHKAFKKPLFILIAITIIMPTLLISGTTVYLNTISDSKGPVHWHTDIEFWVCNQEIELRNPRGFVNNKVGTSTFHEHNDKRMHLEGVVIDKEYDASLEKFLKVTGGEITDNSIVIPTEDYIFEDDLDGDQNTKNQDLVRNFLTRDEKQLATLSIKNGDSCSSQGGYAEIQAFLFTFNKTNDTYTQTKLKNPKEYIMRDESVVPPGDCLIVEFDTVKNKTDKLCQQYGVIDRERCVQFGVKNFDPKLCKIREVKNETNQPLIPMETI